MKVTEITVTVGVTRSLGRNTYEFARIDISNRATLDESCEPDSKEYRMAHKELVTAVQSMVEKAERLAIPEEE